MIYFEDWLIIFGDDVNVVFKVVFFEVMVIREVEEGVLVFIEFIWIESCFVCD